MNYEISSAIEDDKESLAELRIFAMKESLENIGRFDPVRARSRFLETFNYGDIKKVLINQELAGFYVLKNNEDHVYVDHLYVHPKYQSLGLGSVILSTIKDLAKSQNLPIRLGALRESRSNEFYKKNGFSYTHEEEWDIYYEFTYG
ncbi:MAG: GNAT superfamily N-acetyltransferase [Paraglaciecola psychrophila]|jgi:GNAT superfamily N-acetyltransferase